MSANPITPERVGSSTKAIFAGTQPQQRAFAQALLGDDKHSGYTLDEFRVRAIAAGVPIWEYMWGRQDLNFMVRRAVGPKSRAGGQTYMFAHSEPKGQKATGTTGPRDSQSTIKRTSMGDEERRWLHVGGDIDPLPKVLAKRAEQRARECIEHLREQGFSDADMLATKSIAWLDSKFGLGLSDEAPAKPRRRVARKRTPKPKAEAATA